jgi:hypothetical protein
MGNALPTLQERIAIVLRQLDDDEDTETEKRKT